MTSTKYELNHPDRTECKGCQAYTANGCLMMLVPEISGVVCPCVNCITKPVCRDICEEFSIFKGICNTIKIRNYKSDIQRFENG
jgi:hypothetical protein